MNKFPERLKELREKRGLSKSQLSYEIGYSQPAITRWENGLQVPNIEVAITVAKYFDVSTDYLLGMID